MNYLSLFSGVGGLDLGLDRAGMTCVGQVEIDPWCRKVLAKHWPEVPKHDDVRTAPQWWLGRGASADLVAGGFPCQGHSVAGRRRGTGDERWGWPWYRAVLETVNPPWVLIENVPNLVRTGLVDVLGDLAVLGFDAWWGCVPAAAVGAPHLRWRLFVIAAHSERVQLRHEPGWVCGPDREGPPVIGHDGTAWALANAEGVRRELRSPQGQRPGRPPGGGSDVANAHGQPSGSLGSAVAGDGRTPLLPGGPSESRRRGGTVANASGEGLEGPWGLHNPGPSGRPGVDVADGGWWAVEPDVGRVAHGVPARVDRLRGLGNAVVPQVAEHIGRLILAADLERAA